VAEFFFEYGLFAAKTLTFILIIVFAIGFLIAAAAAKASKQRETLEIENINDKLDDYKDAMEAEILSKEEYKAIQKSQKKQDRQERKERKKRLKSGEDEEFKSRLFLVRFDGDLHASEVENLRESITAILSVAKPSDEVLIILDSHGGVVHNYGLAASQLVRIKEKQIKLTVSVDLIAASGGYMMACVADHIIAAPFAVLGSIGVLAEVPNFHGLLQKHKVDIEHHTAGEYKTTLTMLAKNTDKGREKFQEELDEIHVLFKNFVSENRPQVDINKIATGEVWYGTQALEVGLIDAIKTSDDYIVEKSANSDIYDISLQVHENLKEKISAMLYKSTSTALERLWYKISHRFNFVS
jgi:serine protease SohB